MGRRRKNRQNGVTDAGISKPQQQQAGSQPKKKRVRPMAWEKRGEEKHGVKETREQDEEQLADIDEYMELEAKREAQEIEEDELELLRDVEAERERTAADRIRREAEALELRTYLPVAEINDSKLVPLTSYARNAVQLFDTLCVITRNSKSFSKAEKAQATEDSKLIAKTFLEKVCRFSGDVAANLASSKFTKHLTMDSTSGHISGFKHITPPLNNPSYKFLVQDPVEGLFGAKNRIVFLIRGVAGFLTRINLLQEVYEHARSKGTTIDMCFYLSEIKIRPQASVGKFSNIWPLSTIAALSHDDANLTEELRYLCRRFNSLARAREVEDSANWVRQDMSDWMKKYSKQGTNGRNKIDGIAKAGISMADHN